MFERVWCLGVPAWGVALVACGFPKPPDVSGSDASLTDAPRAPRCNPAASFGAPRALTSLNSTEDDGFAHLAPDELTIYFSSNRPGTGGFDIFEATRSSISVPFANVVPVTGVNTPGDEAYPNVTADGLSLFAFSQPTAASFRHLTLATRTNTTVAFGPLQILATVNGPTNDSDPYVLPAGNVLYFASDRAGNYSLYRSAKNGETFTAPTIVSGVDLDTASVEATPVVSPDELTLFFGSLRAGGAGDYDIYVVTRPTLADGFGAPVPVTELNTADFEIPTWISADSCDLYLTRRVTNATNHIFVATRGQ